jgi:hypothetical protein
MMGTRITGGEPPKKRGWNQTDKYPALEVGCLNTVEHIGYKIVNFKIPAGVATKKCPQCGRKVGRE